MPETFTWGDFSQGWCPSDDALKGRKNGLLQMDNLELDKNGALTLAGGTSVVGTYSQSATDIFSNVISGVRHDYVADVTGAILRDGSSIATGGDTAVTAFGVAYDYTLILSGNKRLKDTGSGTPINLGLQTPDNISSGINGFTVKSYVTSTAVISTASHTEVSCSASYSSGLIEITVASGVSGISQASVVGAPLNWATLSSGGSTPMADNDVMQLSLFEVNGGVGFGTLKNTASVTIDFLLAAPTGATPVSDYFTFTWDNSSGGTTAPNIALDIRRSDFTRVGSGSQSWTSVYGFRISVVAEDGKATIVRVLTTGSGGGFAFQGGLAGQLTASDYEYVALNVNHSSSYIAKSQVGPTKTIPFPLKANSIVVTAFNPTGLDAQCNEVWIFRRGGTLGQFYRVLVLTAAGSWTGEDSLTDDDARTLGITINYNLVSVNSTYLTQKIKGLIGPIEGRWMYFTDGAMYPSDINTPDLVDTSIGVKFTGGNSEIFLWAKKVGDASILIGTNLDVYLLTGTFTTLPDFSVDIYLRPLACKYPPITFDATYYGGSVFYLAGDGWRSINQNGDNPLLTAPNTDRLYRNITCYGYSTTINLNTAGGARSPIAVYRGKLWCCITGSHRIEVLDFKRAYWRNVDFGLTDVQAICNTQDGKLIGFFSDKKLRNLDVQTSLLIDGASKQAAGVLSSIFEFDKPKQRKELYAIKISCDTGGDNLAVTLIEDNGTGHSIGNVSSSGFSSQILPLETTVNGLVLHNFQIRLSGTFGTLTIGDVTIEYDTRPQQLPSLHILPFNLGTIARKRLSNLPLTIDTLSNAVTLSVYLDGSLDGTLAINTTYKKSISYEFGSSSPALTGIRDIELFLNAASGVFEYFSNDNPRKVETFPDPTLAYVSPQTNYNSTNRKRIRVLKFQLDCLATTVIYTPIIDGSAGLTQTYSGAGKKTYYYYFSGDQIGVDFQHKFTASDIFELWEIHEPAAGDIEVFPERVRYYTIPVTNYGTTSRKRLRLHRFILDTLGNDVTFTPIIDGATQTTSTFVAGSGKKTVYHYYTTDQIGVDFSGTFSSAGPFELWEVLPPEEGDLEKFPDRVRYYRSPKTNFGIDARKRVRTWSYIIDPLGAATVTINVYLDGSLIATDNALNGLTGKRTGFHIFNPDVTGYDYEFEISASAPVEVWSINTPGKDEIEVFPEPVGFHTIPVTNYGTSSRKRIRLHKFVLDCKSATITFTPIIDGSSQATSTFTGAGKKTFYHYYTSDQVGVDWSGTLSAAGGLSFEVWEVMQPSTDNDIEVLPDRVEYLKTRRTNFGTNGRKRLRAWPYVIDALGATSVAVNIYGNNTLLVQDTSLSGTTGKTTSWVFLNPDKLYVDYWMEIIASGPIEIYNIPDPSKDQIEVYPDPVFFHTIPTTNFGHTGRKRVRLYKFVLDTMGHDVTFTPIIDGANQATTVFNGNKKTYYHYFTSDQIGVDFSGTLSAAGQFEVWGVIPPSDIDIEKFPDRIEYFVIPVTNLGSTSRKRLRLMKFVLDPLSSTVTFNPVIDGSTISPAATYSGAGKRTVYYYFTADQIGVDFSGIFTSTGPFELWDVVTPRDNNIEVFPDRLEYFITPKMNFGIDARKRIRTWGVVINPLSAATVTVTPVIDGVAETADNSLNGQNGKRTYYYFFNPDQIGIDFELQITASGPFEVWEVLSPGKDEIEVYPEPVTYLTIPTTNFGTSSRKRVRVLKFVLDTKGHDVIFTPIIDGVSQSTTTFNSAIKKTFYHWFTSDKIGVDFSGTLSGANSFEVWQIMPPEAIDIETFPDRLEYFITPKTNFGTDARKRVRAWAVVINPLGATTITVKTYIDGSLATTDTSLSGQTGKRTFQVFFSPDMVGVDFELEIVGSGPFELFDVMQPGKDEIEVYPEQVKYYTLPTTQFGSPRKKRIRVWTFVIDTRSSNVVFTPYVDNVAQSTATFNTTGRTTVFYFFKSDVFGIDYYGTFDGAAPFELWSVGEPNVVQTLPIAKQYDQVGPTEFFRFGKLRRMEMRVLPFGTTIPYNIMFDDASQFSGALTVASGIEQTVTVPLPKTIGGDVIRIEFGPTAFNFHKYYIRLQVQKTGRDTDMEWVTIQQEETNG